MKNIVDITGQKFGKLTAVKPLGKGLWLFNCDCGSEKITRKSNAISGDTKSCGCLYLESGLKRTKDISGKKFHYLTAIRFTRNIGRMYFWLFKCDCGQEKEINRVSVTHGNTKSCGCKGFELRSLAKVKYGDITNQKFHFLTAVKSLGTKNKNRWWLFRCDCGIEKELIISSVVRGTIKSCGCRRFDSLNRTVDIQGLRFGALVVVQRARKNKNHTWYWECQCDCGNTCEVLTEPLRKGSTRTCGCKILFKGENNAKWKGGRHEKGGYAYKYAPNHPNAVKGRYVCEHRLVMEEKLGRYLLPSENVHHINGIRNDNRPENLELWVKTQPCGQRASDLIAFSLEILKTYAPEKLATCEVENV